MPKYIRLYNQFLNFVRTAQTEDDLSLYEKKLLNLIIEDFDNIKDKKFNNGQRGKHIYGLIKKKGAAVNSEIVLPALQNQTTGFPFDRLRSIEVEHFRGFSEKEIFVFDRPFTFVYGPNGSGKSSLCEALEFSMLGSIQEAIAKSIDIKEYNENCFSKKRTNPILKGVDKAGKEITVNSNPDLQFCFIEKSRIESFARISANSPKKMEEQLANLFGLNEFNDFVKDFNKNPTEYFDLKPLKAEEYQAKSVGVPALKKNIAEENAKKVAATDKLAQVLKNTSVSSESEFETSFVKPADGKRTRLEDMTAQLALPTPMPLGHPALSTIELKVAEAQEAASILTKTRAELASKKNEVSFRELFDAALKVEAFWTESCPLCETPMNKVVKNPYENARTKKEELEGIIALEVREGQEYLSLLEKIRAMDNETSSLNSILKLQGKDIFTFGAVSDFEKKANEKEVALLYVKSVEDFISLNRAKLAVAQSDLDAIDTENQITATSKAKIQAEYERLKKEKDTYIQEKANVANCNTRIEKYQKDIDDFEASTATLKAEVEGEKKRIAENMFWLAAHEFLLERLEKYKAELPLKYVKKISELTCHIYNLLNQHDRDYDKAASIDLPKTSEDVIRIQFTKSPNEKFDALLVLSEGHLRCLGLAILLAKNIDDGCPVVIFDDVVNAIDDEHRSGVADLLFDLDSLRKKQIILTTHTLQFMTDLQQKVAADKVALTFSVYNLQSDEHRRKINVNSKTRNHLELATEYLKDNQFDDSLHKCRLAMDNITVALWKGLKKKGCISEIPIPLRDLNKRPDTNPVLKKLVKVVREKNATEFMPATEHLDYLLNDDIWGKLNKASHDEEGKETFNPVLVKEIVTRCRTIDAIVKP